MTRPVRVAVINSHPIQYFAPLYAYLNQDSGLEITALYCSDFSLRGATDPGFGRTVKWDVDLLSGHRVIFLGERAKRRRPRGFWSLIVPELWTELRSRRYDAVWLHGYSYAAFILAFAAAKSRGLPVFMRTETHLGLSRSRWRRRLRDGILSRAYRFVDGFLAIGTANRQYYLSLGVPAERIFHVPYAVDNERFIRESALSADERVAIRRRLGLPERKPVILYASKFLRRKHPDCVLRAAKILHDRGLDFAVLMVGSGEMEAELLTLANRLGLAEIVFGGFINQAELPSVFAASDVFVLPAENEPWGLVVNEVMCAAVAVVVAEGIGCVTDLVVDGVTGKRIIAGDAESLAAAVEPLLHDHLLRRSLGKTGRDVIGRWSYAQCLVGVNSACAMLYRPSDRLPLGRL